MKVLSVVGARPQFVKAAPVSRVLRATHDELLVHTGQHYDDAMSAAFFRDLEIPAPEVNLEVGSGSHAAQTADIMRRLEPVLMEHEPDGMLIYGDTNSTLAAAVVGSKIAYPDGRRPWVAHVEAGLRSFNRAMPEERNRVVADHLADLLLAPTPVAMRHLSREGLAQRAELVGDVMVDSHLSASAVSDAHVPPVAVETPGYVLLTMHRAENVDDPRRLQAWMDALEQDEPIIFPVHPRTAGALSDSGVKPPANVRIIDPVGYLQMVALERHARAVLTDSGGVQKEAYLSGVPCITLRSETEWVETVEAGWNRLVEPSRAAIRAALDDAAFMNRDRARPELYGDGRAADRIVLALERQQAMTAASMPLTMEVTAS